MSLLLVEDHPIFVHALQQLIGHHYPQVAVRAAASCAEACAWLRDTPAHAGPAAILCDLHLPDATGVAAVQHIQAVTRCPVIVISAACDDAVLQQLCRLGIAHFVSKREDATALLRSLGPFLGPPQASPGPERRGEVLSASQRRVAHLLLEGLPNKEIAHRLGVAPDTVKSHVHEIIARLGVRNRTEAVLRLTRER